MAVVLPRSADLLAPGQRIGPFLLLAPLGAGGAGRVWAVARTGQLGFTKRMVLKVMRQDKLHSERARERFDREARLGAQLRHRHLRGVHELGSHSGRPYMALSWVDSSLAELLELAPDRRLEPSVACWIAIQTCDGLEAAHGHVDHAQRACPIVHGDVSPGNILLTSQGHVLLADLAGDAGAPQPDKAEEAAPARFFGSLGYASPEALRGQPLDGRADLFSLGCVLYEVLCGAPAFEADDERSLLYQVLEREPPELRQRAPEVTPELAAVVRRALARRVEERFQSAEEMSAALRACVRGQSAFRLEERSAALIQRVLGERLRAREEEMRGVLQRFSASQFERTDTLPIASAAPGRATTTLRAGVLEPVSEGAAAVSRSAEPAARLKSGRWGFWAIAFVALSLAVGYAVSTLRRAPLQAVAPAVEAASATGVVSEQTQQALRGAPAPAVAAPAPAAAAAPSAREAAAASTREERAAAEPAATESAAAEPAQAKTATLPAMVSPAEDRPEPAVGRAEPAVGRPDPAPPRKLAPARRAPAPAEAAPAPAEAAPEAPQRPFQWKFPDDPYAPRGRAPASKSAAEAR
ncbi:MAG TPA: serine/threonine-protein kinase [Polyangiaceae bacterium]|nr:serine/threonine-protein kinase [Polyangiaceae bacterium]